jgi:hypothetical protein
MCSNEFDDSGFIQFAKKKFGCGRGGDATFFGVKSSPA